MIEWEKSKGKYISKSETQKTENILNSQITALDFSSLHNDIEFARFLRKNERNNPHNHHLDHASWL